MSVTAHRLIVAGIVGLGLGATPAGQAPVAVEVLRPVDALPVHLFGTLTQPVHFQQTDDGTSYLFDRRDHAVYRIDPTRTTLERLIEVGTEAGRILRPSAFDLSENGTFVVADAPNNHERIQFFAHDGHRLAGFAIPGRAEPRITIGDFVLNGIGTLEYTGRSLLISQPERRALVTEYGLAGTPLRTFGQLRATGHEDDRDVHLALNAGIPLAAADGGFFFVFHTGVPLFQKYDRDGTLRFERHVEGPEMDAVLRGLPGTWPSPAEREGTLPLVPPSLRTAAVDPAGRLWIALTVPYVYVYDPNGEKVARLQLVGNGPLSPTSLAFDRRGRVLVTPGGYIFAAGLPSAAED